MLKQKAVLRTFAFIAITITQKKLLSSQHDKNRPHKELFARIRERMSSFCADA